MNSSISNLPDHLMHLIISRLTPLSKDYVRFGAVCKEWYDIQREHRKQIRSKTEIPVLLIPSKHGAKTRRSVFDMTRSKRFDSLHPYLRYSIKACGSSYGWLIFVDKMMHIILENPFVTRTRKNKANVGKIVLPPVMPKPNAWFYEYSVSKVILFGNPSLCSDYLALAFYAAPNCLALFKSWSPTKWIYLKDFCTKEANLVDIGFMDANYYKGKIYVVNSCQGIYEIDAFSDKNGNIHMNIVFKWEMTFRSRMYIAESSNGDLLLIKRFDNELDWGEEDDVWEIKTLEFKVYKILLDENKMVEIDNLDGDAIFVSDGQTMCVAASEFENCRPNSIYFTDDAFTFPIWDCTYVRKSETGPRDSGIFCMDDKTIKPLYPYCLKSHKDLPPPIWVLPMF